MGLSKYKIGDFVNPISIKCGISKCKDVQGININKEFFPSRNIGENTSKYLEVPPSAFAMNLMHIGRDERIPIALNITDKNIVVSPAYEVFNIIENNFILLEYFNIIIRSSEFDRYAWFCTDSSIRGNLDWKRFCDIEIKIPPVDVQKKYIDIYNAMKANQEVYVIKYNTLKSITNISLEKIKNKSLKQQMKECILEVDNRNSDGIITQVHGINIEKTFMKSVANTSATDLTKYKTVNVLNKVQLKFESFFN